MIVYLDTSVVVSLIVTDSHTDKADAWYRQTTLAPVISSLVKLEFAATISRYLRINRLTEPAAEQALDLFDRWVVEETHCVEIAFDDMSRADRIVRNFTTKLAGPDAIHLALAIKLGLPIATFDDRLAAAARMHTVEAILPG